MSMCRKCQAALQGDVTVCPSCGHLVGVPFLSVGLDGFVDDPGPGSVSVSRKEDFGDQDALIVGTLGSAFTSFHGNSDRFTPLANDEDYLTAPTGDVERPVSPVPIYIDTKTADLLRPESVLRVVDAAKLAERSPIEQYVAGFLDGMRPVARVAKKAGLSHDDLSIALALLADARLIHLAGFTHAPTSKADERAPADELPEKTLVDAAAPAAMPDPQVLELPSDAMTPLPLPAQAPPPPRRATPARPAPAPVPEAVPSPVVGDAVPLEAISGARVVISPSDPKDVKLYKQACMKEFDGDYDTALRLLRHALMLNPRAAILHNRLGVILATRLGEYKAATDALLTAVGLEPDNTTYKSNLAKVMEAAPDDMLSFGVDDRRDKAGAPQGLGGLFKRKPF